MRKSATLASLAAGSVLLAAAILLFSSRGDRVTTPSTGGADDVRAAGAEDALVATGAVPSETRSAADERAPLVSPADVVRGAAAGRDASTEGDAKPTARIVGRVLDLAGAPIEGAALVAPIGAFSGLPPAWVRPQPLPVHARSDADGRLAAAVDLTGIPLMPSGPQNLLRLGDVGPNGRVEVPTEGSARGAVAAEGYVGTLVWVELRAGESFDLGEVRLAPGARVRGRVLTAAGAPVGGAEVRWCSGSPVRAEALAGRGFPRSVETGLGYAGFLQATSAPDGSFELPGVPLLDPADARSRAAAGYLVAKAEGPRWGVSDALSARAAPLDDVAVHLEPSAQRGLVRGRVLRPDGSPAADAMVRFVPVIGATGQGVPVDAAGRFEYPTEPPYGVMLSAFDPSGSFYPSEPREASAGDVDVVLTLVEGAFLEVRLVSNGRPVPSGVVRTVDVLGGPRVIDGWPGTSLGESGVTRLLLPRQAFSVEAQAPGFVRATLGPFDPLDFGDFGKLGPTLVLELDPGAAIRGTVVADGKPVAGARVGISLSPYPAGVVTTAIGVAETRAPFDLVAMSVIDDRDAISGSDGAFVAPLPGTGNFTLSAEAPGYPPRTLGPFAWTSPDGASGLVLELERGGALAGRVIPPDGESAEGRVVAISNGTGQAWTQTVGGDGAYRFDGLPPGGWQVRHALPPVASRAQMHAGGWYGERREPAWDVIVAPDGTARFDLDLSRRGRVRLVGSLLIDGRPAEHARASLRRRADGEPPRVAVMRGARSDPSPSEDAPPVLEPPPLAEAPLDAQGRFTLDLEEPGDVVLELSRGRWRILRDLSLAEGEASFELELRTGSLRLIDATPEDSGGTDLWGAQLLLEHPSGARVFCELVGRLWVGDDELVEDVPAGALALLQARNRERQPSWRKLLDAEAWDRLRAVEVPAGGEARLEFR